MSLPIDSYDNSISVSCLSVCVSGPVWVRAINAELAPHVELAAKCVGT